MRVHTKIDVYCVCCVHTRMLYDGRKSQRGVPNTTAHAVSSILEACWKSKRRVNVLIAYWIFRPPLSLYIYTPAVYKGIYSDYTACCFYKLSGSSSQETTTLLPCNKYRSAAVKTCRLDIVCVVSLQQQTFPLTKKRNASTAKCHRWNVILRPKK